MGPDDTKTVETPGSQTLAKFQEVVQQNEGIFGPLKALGKNKQNNTITLDVGSTPNNRAILETYEGDKPPTKDGFDSVCSGDCLVEGKAAKVAAYRKSKAN
jgi:hypothetical protein